MGFRFSQPQGLCASILYLCGWLLTSGAIDAAQAQAVVCGVHCVAPVANQGTGQGAAGTSTLIGQLFGGGSTGGVDGYWGGGSTGGVDGYRPGGGLGIRLSGGGGTGGVYGF